MEREFEIARAVAQQIDAEQNRVASRMNWNLTFQGFMIASFALIVAAQNYEPGRKPILAAICIAGLVVAIGTYLGLWAASRQSGQLKEHWKAYGLGASGHPIPFSDGRWSWLGRIPPRLICFAIAAMWTYLLFNVYVGQFDFATPLN